MAVFRETGKPKTESKTAYERKLKRGIFLYSLFALLLIPFYTIKLATRADVMNYSISFVGNALGHRQSLDGDEQPVFHQLFVLFTNFNEAGILAGQGDDLCGGVHFDCM